MVSAQCAPSKRLLSDRLQGTAGQSTRYKLMIFVILVISGLAPPLLSVCPNREIHIYLFFCFLSLKTDVQSFMNEH